MENKNKRENRFTSIKFVMPKVAKDHGAEDYFLKHKIFLAWQDVVSGFFEEAKQLTKAMDYRNGTLTVASLSEELGLKIRELSQQLMKALNELLGRNLVFKIIVEV